MISHGFDIIVTDKSVDVSRNPTTTFRNRFLGALFLVGVSLVFVAGISLLPNKEGASSTWRALTSKPIDYSQLWANFCFIFPFALLMGWYFVWYVRAAWPADDALHCDHNGITISRTRWFDTKDKLVSHAYSKNEISQMRYAILASGRGNSIYGLQFKLKGKKQKLLAGLEAPEAKAIMDGLNNLGIDVIGDPKLDKRVKQVVEMRGGDTSWMDRSWMDDDSSHKNS